MAATLQERLNYLVNYSSQLIFVGGDSLSSQTKALESFLFQQGENTEIAYIVAEQNTPLIDFRRHLCQQLLGESTQFYHRPLNECLATLNSFDGPVMIAITRAELIPQQLLQELWELVLQSRFAGNKQHLNVVLFADKTWAQEAKTWLPENNSGTPLLLSTQQASLYKAVPESMMEDPISARLQADQSALEEHEIEQRPLFSMGAFWAATLLIFLCVFIGVAIWYKGDQISNVFGPLNFTSDTPQPVIEESAKTPVSVWQPSVSIEQADKEEDTQTLSESTSDKNINELTQAASNMEETASVKEPDSKLQDPPSEIILAETQTNTSVDFQPTTLIEEEPQFVIEPGLFAIQLAAFSDERLLDRFIKENNLSEKTQRYETVRNNAPWYVIIATPLHSSVAAARDAIPTLPDFPNKASVFVKSTDTILLEQQRTINPN